MTEALKISSSKSLVNRYLILKEGHPQLKLDWSTQAKDVLNLEAALKEAPHKKEYAIGEGGTTLRFFATYLSTFSGLWTLNCSEGLLKRPQSELISALRALGAELQQVSPTSLRLHSKGWQKQNIEIDAKDSTQVLTGLTLAAVSRGLPLQIKLKQQGLNSDYFEMTKQFLDQIGFVVESSEKFVNVIGEQFLASTVNGKIESDWSSAAFLYVMASLKGDLTLGSFQQKSLQPDSIVLELLQEVGAVSKRLFQIQPGKLPYKNFKMNVQRSPDLFPVLSTLACFCIGESKIYGAPQLKNKETDRIDRVYDLLSLCGYHLQKQEDGLLVLGKGLDVQNEDEISFDVSKDHRLYMATEILTAMGYKIKVHGAESILKSFAEYESLKTKELSCFF